MESNIQISYFKPDRQGVFQTEEGVYFAVEVDSAQESGLILLEKGKERMRIPFLEQGRRGTLYGICLSGNLSKYDGYLYYTGEETFVDPYARGIHGREKWGDFSRTESDISGRLLLSDFDWEGDEPLQTPVFDTIIYGLGVRSFTMHRSAGVKNKGTFEGITEKLPYLKQLGITAIELLPAYEFEECMKEKETGKQTMEEAVRNCNRPSEQEEAGTQTGRLNCWGFIEGNYFAPKASYSKDKPELSFKRMVKAFHENGIEVMMQFYFPPETEQAFILEVLKYWVIEYHIDGVRISGIHLPLSMIAREPVLRTTKLRSVSFPLEEIYPGHAPLFKNLLMNDGSFRMDLRKYLKGDENQLNRVLFHQRQNPALCGVVNDLADYDGFSLYDCVSYEKKHNEANQEENRDGAEVNCTWNCGAEGESRKKAILLLRRKQLKNALCFLFLSQGVPYLFAGDEMANTRFGNNNAYCQDNETGWVKWKKDRFAMDIQAFTCELIALRKAHPVLHQEKECRIMDSLGCGYPDISYHGTEAWRPDLSYIGRIVGIMLCGQYAGEDTSFYLAFNMHWEKQKMALPKLPAGQKWVCHLTTAEEKPEADSGTSADGRLSADDSSALSKDGMLPEAAGKEAPHKEAEQILVEGRSVAVFLAVSEKTSRIRKNKTGKQVG